MKVLVTGAGALLGQGIIRSLRASSLECEIVAVDPSPLSAGLYWADRRHLIPFATDPAYLERVRELLDRERPDAVLIGTDVELPIFAAAREELEAEFGTHVAVSSPEVIEIADDKWQTYQLFSSHGLGCPDSCLPGDEAALVARVGFPLIVKPRRGFRSFGVRLVRDVDQLRAAIAATPDAVIQECVGTPEDEYTAGVLHLPGQPTVSIVMRRDLRDGNTYRAYAAEYPELNSQVQEMARALGPWGPVNFQFRLAANKTAKTFEINARFSGTTPLRALAGFNEVEMLLRHLLRGEPIVQPPVRPVVVLRHWSETVVSPAEVEPLADEPVRA